MTRIHFYAVCLVALVLSACASTPPFSADRLVAVNHALTPQQVAQAGAKNEQVMWGGVIVSVANIADHTDLTVLAYPLDSAQRPDEEQPSQGRFIVRYPGYLETLVYAPGREVTVLGPVQGVEEGKVGDAPYRYPVLQSESVHLWSPRTGSRVRFGVGVGVRL